MSRPTSGENAAPLVAIAAASVVSTPCGSEAAENASASTAAPTGSRASDMPMRPAGSGASPTTPVSKRKLAQPRSAGM